MKNTKHMQLTYLVGGAPTSTADFDLIYEKPSKIVAVDGGANALPIGLIPHAIVGDMDSIDLSQPLDSQTKFVRLTDQNSTDFEKAISYCLEKNLPQPFVCIGFIGGRFDQTLTIQHVCCLYPDVRFVFVTQSDVVISLPLGSTHFSMNDKDRVSLYPLTPCSFGKSEGLLYPLNGLNMIQGSLIGTSNQTSRPDVKITLTEGLCFLVVETKNIKTVLKAVEGA